MFLGEDFWEISLPHNISCKLKIPGGTTMRKKNYKGRCEKKSVQKCNEIFKAYDAVQSAYVNVLSSRDDIIEIRCNVTLEDMEYTSDFCVFETYIPCTDTELFEAIGNVPDIESLESEQIRVMHERYTIIAGVLPYIGNVKIRSCGIDEVARTNHISKQTVRNYLCKYLTYMDILALSPKKKDADRELSSFEKNIRWGLNKFFYSQKRNSLHTAYTMMLKEKYCLSAVMERHGIENLKTLEQVLDTSPEYQLPESQGLMSAKTYKNKLAEPLVQKLKSLVKTALIRYFEAYDSYYRLNITNSNLHRENERLTKTNEKLAGENENLRAENKNYKLLKKAFGSKQMDSLLEQAKAVQQSKQRGKHFRNNQEER